MNVSPLASPPNPVMGATVAFQSLLFLPSRNSPVQTNGDSSSSQYAMKVLLSSSQNAVQTDGNGLASLQLASAPANRALEAEITASTSTGAALQFEWQILPPFAASLPGGTNGTGSNSVNRTGSAPPRAQESEVSPRKVWSGKAEAVATEPQTSGGYTIFNYGFPTPPPDPCETDQAAKEQEREDSASESSDSGCRK